MRRHGSAAIAGLAVGTLGAAALHAASLHAASLHAQAPAESRVVGPFVGIGAETNVIAPNPGGVSAAGEPGHGGGLVLGYGSSRRWAAYGHVGPSRFRAT